MKRKFQSYLLLATLICSSLTIAQPGAVAASSSICNSVSCDNPQVSTIFGQSTDRPLDRSPAPSLAPICEIASDWKVVVITAVVANILKVSFVYTLVPTVVCR
jgi:hypothetical protein